VRSGPKRKAPVRRRSERPSSRTNARRLEALIKRARKSAKNVLLIGVGNEMLADDGVGCLIANDLGGLESQGFIAASIGTAIENSSHLIRRHKPGLLIITDAAVGIARKDTWALVPPARLDVLCHSTHALPLPLLISAWRNEAPDLDVRFLGIVPHVVEFGAEPSRQAMQARAEIVAMIRKALDEENQRQDT
jgi:hydrogenase maturation protease